MWLDARMMLQTVRPNTTQVRVTVITNPTLTAERAELRRL